MGLTSRVNGESIPVLALETFQVSCSIPASLSYIAIPQSRTIFCPVIDLLRTNVLI
jgi:hypothetical protein